MSKLFFRPIVRRRLVYSLVWALLLAMAWLGLCYVRYFAAMPLIAMNLRRYQSAIRRDDYAAARQFTSASWQRRHSEEEQRDFYLALQKRHGGGFKPRRSISPFSKFGMGRYEISTSFELGDGYRVNVIYELLRVKGQQIPVVNYAWATGSNAEPGPW